MLLTEEDAKGKWCPFTRYLAIFRGNDGRRETAGSYNRGAEDSALGNACCLASQCMAWRSTGSTVEFVRGVLDDGSPAPKPEGDGWELGPRPHSQDAWWKRPTAPRGFCGLAGRPA